MGLSSMLRGSETWPVGKENEVALQRAEMRMVRWMCGVKLQDRVPSKTVVSVCVCHHGYVFRIQEVQKAELVLTQTCKHCHMFKKNNNIV